MLVFSNNVETPTLFTRQLDAVSVNPTLPTLEPELKTVGLPSHAASLVLVNFFWSEMEEKIQKWTWRYK